MPATSHAYTRHAVRELNAMAADFGFARGGYRLKPETLTVGPLSVFFDIDGTCQFGKSVHPDDLSATQRALQNGRLVAPITGRPEGAMAAFEPVDFLLRGQPVHGGFADGATTGVWDPESRLWVPRLDLPGGIHWVHSETLRGVIEEAESLTGSELWVEVGVPGKNGYDFRNPRPDCRANDDDHVGLMRHELPKLGLPWDTVRASHAKFLLVDADEQALAAMIEEIGTRHGFEARTSAVRDRDENGNVTVRMMVVILTPVTASKATAMKVIAAQHGLHPSASWVIGDAWNDKPSMKEANVSVAAVNAHESIKEFASHVDTVVPTDAAGTAPLARLLAWQSAFIERFPGLVSRDTK